MAKLNKKSIIFAFGLAVVLLIVLIRVYYLVHTRTAELNGEFAIGTNQINLFVAMQEAEKAMLYGEEGFSLSFQEALYATARSGGYAKTPSCGKLGEYTVWRKDNDTECYPTINGVKQSIAESAIAMLGKSYLSSNPYTKSSIPYKTNHEIFISQEGDILTGRAYAFAPLEQDIRCDYAKESKTAVACGKYYYKPSFRKDLKFGINDFEAAASDAKEFSKNMEGCTTTLASCAANELKRINLNGRLKWSLCEASSSPTDFKLCINTGNKLLVYDETTKNMEIKDVEIRFALSFP